MSPLAFVTRSISAAARCLMVGSRIEVNTVDCSTRSKPSSRAGRLVADPRILTFSDDSFLASATRSSKSIPVIFSGLAPHDELSKPIAGSASDLENAYALERQQPLLLQRGEYVAFSLLHEDT